MPEGIVQVTEGTGKKLHTWQRTIGANTVEDEYVIMGLPAFASYVALGVLTTTATAASHQLQIMAGATLNVYVTRVRVYQMALATTAAIGGLYIVRLSTAGTGGGAVTPVLFDTTDGASGATAMTLPTVKGTESATLHIGSGQFIQTVPTGGNGQASLLMDWDAMRDRIKAIRIPAGVTNGIALKNVTAIAAATVLVSIEFFEASY